MDSSGVEWGDGVKTAKVLLWKAEFIIVHHLVFLPLRNIFLNNRVFDQYPANQLGFAIAKDSLQGFADLHHDLIRRQPNTTSGDFNSMIGTNVGYF